MRHNDKQAPKKRRSNSVPSIMKAILCQALKSEAKHQIHEWAIKIWETIEPWLSDLF